MTPSKNRLAVMTGSLVAVAVACVAGCSGSDSKDDASATAGTASSPAASSGSPAAPNAAPTRRPRHGRKTPDTAVTAWIKAIMANDVTKYCLANAQPASEGRPAAPATMAQCGSKNPHHQEQAALVKGLHTAFMPPHPTQPTTVALSGVEKHGTTAEVTGDHVVVDGSKLSDIVSSHSKNTTSGRSKLTLEMVRIKSAWYMGDSHLGF